MKIITENMILETFLKRIIPEKVTYFPDLIEIRAGWDLVQEFILNK